MDSNWWKQAKGIKPADRKEFQKLVDDAGPDKFIIVDFFMPQCGYCVKFMNQWNQIVTDMTAEYGEEHIQFLKVDGVQDYYTSSRYNIQSFPSFIILEPGSKGDQWEQWRPQHRDYAGMK